jgi:hypothetical protein
MSIDNFITLRAATQADAKAMAKAEDKDTTA